MGIYFKELESELPSDVTVETLQHTLLKLRSARDREADDFIALFPEIDTPVLYENVHLERGFEPIPFTIKELEAEIEAVQEERAQILYDHLDLVFMLDSLSRTGTKSAD